MIHPCAIRTSIECIVASKILLFLVEVKNRNVLLVIYGFLTIRIFFLFCTLTYLSICPIQLVVLTIECD